MVSFFYRMIPIVVGDEPAVAMLVALQQPSSFAGFAQMNGKVRSE
ncbi:hypothetical protein [Paenibacillus vietnamensis]|nr:hypothetical protein [Paenibacillus vietnamensis]